MTRSYHGFRSGGSAGAALAYFISAVLFAASTRAQVAPPEHHVRADAPGRWREGFAFRAFGLRGSAARVEADATGDSSNGFGVAERGIADFAHQGISARYRQLLVLGYGSADFEGVADVDLGLGWRPNFGPRHGPVFRLGLRGRLLGNSLLYQSLLEAPQGQVGYQLLGKGLQLELAGRGGMVLAGRYNVLVDARRPLGASLAAGGYATLRTTFAFLELDATRIFASRSAPETAVDEIGLVLCGRFPGGALCTDYKHWSGEVRFPAAGSDRVTSDYVGLSLTSSVWEAR